MKLTDFFGKIKNIKNGEKIIIAGTGSHTKELLQKNPLLKNKISYITSLTKDVHNFMGFQVIYEKEIKKIKDYDLILLSSLSYEKQMYKRLRINGIPKRKIQTLYMSNKEKEEIENDLWIEVVKRDIKKIANRFYTKKNKKRILIYSPVPWIQGNIERMISIKLRMRGHIVDEYICGGGFPSCGVEHDASPRPECNKCLMGAKNWFNLWSLPFKIIKPSKKDIEEAERIVKNMPFTEWKNWEYKGYPMGKRVYEQVYWYLSGDLSNEKKVEERVLKDSISYITGVQKAEKILSKEKYDILIVVNGKTIESGPIIDTAKKKGLNIVTWEEVFVFDWETPANEFRQIGVWEKVKNKKLTKEEREKILKFLYKWRYSKTTPFKYYNKPKEDKELISKQLKLKKGTYKITYFTSIMKDSSVIGIDKVFDSMFESILYFINFVKQRPDYELILRVHPAEAIKQFPPHKIFILETLKKVLRDFPINVKIIPPESEISSYTLIELSDLIITYVGTIGMESPLYGKKSIVLGDVHYAKKGFTIDIDKTENIEKILKNKEVFYSIDQDKEEALKYLYFYFFRVRNKLKIWNKKKQRFEFNNLDFLLDGNFPFFDNIIDSIENGYAFIDLNKKNRTPVKIV